MYKPALSKTRLITREDYPEDEIVCLSNGKEAWLDEHCFLVYVDKSVWEKKYKDKAESFIDWYEDEEDPQKMVSSHYYLIDVETDSAVEDLKVLSDYYEIDEEDLEKWL